MIKAFQQISADLWHRFSLDRLPVFEANLMLFWQWLLANPMIPLGFSVVPLLWACFVIRKSTHDDWTFARVLLVLFLFAIGFGAMAIALHLF